MAADDFIRARMARLTDDELLRVVGVEAGDWTPEALEVAHEEIRRRELIVTVTPPTLPPALTAEDQRRPTYRTGAPIALLVVLLLKILLMLLRH